MASVLIVDKKEIERLRAARIKKVEIVANQIKQKIQRFFPKLLIIFTIDCETEWPGEDWYIGQKPSWLSWLFGYPWDSAIISIGGHYYLDCSCIFAIIKSSKIKSTDTESIRNILIENLAPLAEEFGKSLNVYID